MNLNISQAACGTIQCALPSSSRPVSACHAGIQSKLDSFGWGRRAEVSKKQRGREREGMREREIVCEGEGERGRETALTTKLIND